MELVAAPMATPWIFYRLRLPSSLSFFTRRPAAQGYLEGAKYPKAPFAPATFPNLMGIHRNGEVTLELFDNCVIKEESNCRDFKRHRDDIKLLKIGSP